MENRPSKRRRVEAGVENFIDLEAGVDQDGEDISEDESEHDFIDDVEGDALEAASRPWKQLGLTNDEDEDVESLTQNVRRWVSRNKVQRSPIAVRFECTRVAAPMEGDPGIWRVRVRLGDEEDIIAGILDAATRGSTHALSAFCRDTIPGYIYIESRSEKDVHSTLQSIHGIRPSFPNLLLVPLEDRIPLLTMTAVSLFPKSLSWVRIRKRGTYHGDLALVIGVNEPAQTAEILIVPRLPKNVAEAKGSKRFPPALFDPVEVEAAFGKQRLRQVDEGWNYKRRTYVAGLLQETLSVGALHLDGSTGSEEELGRFWASHHSSVVAAVRSASSVPQIGEKVQVASGPLKGFYGQVKSVSEENQTLTFYERMVEECFDVEIARVHKRHDLGDFVQVKLGIHKGERGYIVDISEDTASIYVFRGGNTDDGYVGEEIEVFSWLLDVAYADDKLGSSVIVLGSSQRPSEESSNPNEPSEALLEEPRKLKLQRDPYRGIHVRIQAGHLKMHQGVIESSFEKAGQQWLAVRTDTQVVNTVIHLHHGDVCEVSTLLPIQKAVHVPASVLIASRHKTVVPPPGYEREPTPPMRSDSPIMEAAWDPEHQLWLRSPSPLTLNLYSHRMMYGRTPTPPIPELPGEWLLGKDLKGNKVEVRIEGTVGPQYYNGIYENQQAFFYAEEVLATLDDSVALKIGPGHIRRSFRIRYLQPELSTERVGFVEGTNVFHIYNSYGNRVLITGPDAYGASDTVGYIGWTADSGYELPLQQTGVMLAPDGPFAGNFRYYDKRSIC